MTEMFHTSDAKDKTTYTRMTYADNGYATDKFGAKNCFVVYFGSSPMNELFFSYQTPVIAKINGRFFRTTEQFSTTTTRHINTYLASRDCPETEDIDQEFFEEIQNSL